MARHTTEIVQKENSEDFGFRASTATVEGYSQLFTTRSEPVARVTLYLADKNKLGDLFGAAWLAIPLGIHIGVVEQHEPL